MSQSKTERQLNLVICLLATRRFLSAQEIRATVHGYGDVESDTAFKRMFERDKKELRDAGIPIITGRHDPLSDEDGYRIARDDYELPPIDLRPDEAAVLGLAARAWRHAVLGEAAANALLKLRSVGVPVDAAALPAVTPVLGADEPAFPSVWQAVRDRRPISFDYRKPGEDTPQRRELEPWGVANVAGHWYVAGYDRDRRARRVFRLSRIVGDVQIHTSAPPVQVPKDVDVRSLINARPPEPEQVAVLEARTDAAHALRRAARRIVAGGAHRRHRMGRGGVPVRRRSRLGCAGRRIRRARGGTRTGTGPESRGRPPARRRSCTRRGRDRRRPARATPWHAASPRVASSRNLH